MSKESFQPKNPQVIPTLRLPHPPHPGTASPSKLLLQASASGQECSQSLPAALGLLLVLSPLPSPSPAAQTKQTLPRSRSITKMNSPLPTPLANYSALPAQAPGWRDLPPADQAPATAWAELGSQDHEGWRLGSQQHGKCGSHLCTPHVPSEFSKLCSPLTHF